MQTPSISEGWPNRNPDVGQTVLLPIVLVWILEGLSLPVLVFLILYPSIDGGGSFVSFLLALTAGWGTFASLLTLLGYRSYRRLTPDRIGIEPNAVVGVYGRHSVGPRAGERRIIPFDGVSELLDARDGYKGAHSPPQVRADLIGVKGFDPKSVGELIHGPPTPKGEARAFYVTKDNLERIRAAYARWKAEGGLAGEPLPESG